jgi:hypothetical protein
MQTWHHVLEKSEPQINNINALHRPFRRLLFNSGQTAHPCGVYLSKHRVLSAPRLRSPRGMRRRMDDRKNLSQPESVITTTEKSPSRNLQKKSCAAMVRRHRRRKAATTSVSAGTRRSRATRSSPSAIAIAMSSRRLFRRLAIAMNRRYCEKLCRW